MWERYRTSGTKYLQIDKIGPLLFSIVALCIKIHNRSCPTPPKKQLFKKLQPYTRMIQLQMQQKVDPNGLTFDVFTNSLHEWLLLPIPIEILLNTADYEQLQSRLFEIKAQLTEKEKELTEERAKSKLLQESLQHFEAEAKNVEEKHRRASATLDAHKKDESKLEIIKRDLSDKAQKLKQSVLSMESMKAEEENHKINTQDLSVLVEIKRAQKDACKEKDEAMRYYDDIIKQCDDYWIKLNGSDLINSFEMNWTQWTIDDTIKWFDFVLTTHNYHPNNDNPNIDLTSNTDKDGYDTSDNSSDDDDDDDDDDDNSIRVHDNEDRKVCQIANKEMKQNSEIDYKDIKSKLEAAGFRAKKNLGFLAKPFNFRQCGFNNMQDCRILCKQTKKLIARYPKKRKNKTTRNVKNQSVGGDLEGDVQNTSMTKK